MDFRQKFEQFVLSRQNLLQSLKLGKYQSITEKELEKHCAVPPPLESFMSVPVEFRTEHFVKSLKIGSIIIGLVRAVQSSGISIMILCGDEGIMRDLSGTSITCFCPLNDLPRYTSHDNPLQSFKLKDKVRGVIIDVDNSGSIMISMNQSLHPEIISTDLKIGLITDEELPSHIQNLNDLRNRSYEEFLTDTPHFNNPGGFNFLTRLLRIKSHQNCSLLKSISQIRIPTEETGKSLTKAQLLNYSTKHVAKGVKYFKEKRIPEAMQCYNFALSVDNSNADAYVARGAIHASSGNYKKAIEDLTRAMSLDKQHPNAQNYFVQTCLAFTKSLIKEKEIKEAKDYLSQILKLEPNHDESLNLLKFIDKGDFSRKSRDRLMESSSSHGKYETHGDNHREPAGKRRRQYYREEVEEKSTDFQPVISGHKKINPEELQKIVITKRAEQDDNYSRSVVMKSKDERADFYASDYKKSRLADYRGEDDHRVMKTERSSNHSRSRSPNSRISQRQYESDLKRREDRPLMREEARSSSRSKPSKVEAYPWSHVDSCSSSSPESPGTSRKQRLYIPSPARRDNVDAKDPNPSVGHDPTSQSDKDVFIKVQEKLRAIEERHKNDSNTAPIEIRQDNNRQRFAVQPRKQFQMERKAYPPYQNQAFKKYNYKPREDHHRRNSFPNQHNQQFRRYVPRHREFGSSKIKNFSEEHEKPQKKFIPRSFRMKEDSVSEEEVDSKDFENRGKPEIFEKLDEPLVIIPKEPLLSPVKREVPQPPPLAAPTQTDEKERSRSLSPMKLDKNETLEHLELFVQQLKAKRMTQS